MGPLWTSGRQTTPYSPELEPDIVLIEPQPRHRTSSAWMILCTLGGSITLHSVAAFHCTGWQHNAALGGRIDCFQHIKPRARLDKLRSVASSAVVASSMGKVEALWHDSQQEKILVIQLHVLPTIIGNAPTQEGSNTETGSPQASGAGSQY